MNKILFDTNILLRLVLKDDTKQLEQIYNLLDMASTGKVQIHCSSISVFETYFVLTKSVFNLSKDKAIGIVRKILEVPDIEFQYKLIFIDALGILTTHNISLPDCFMIAKALREEMDYITLDQKALKIFHKMSTK